MAYGSRVFTQTERNYAQIEKECLAIVFAAERFEHYIMGKDTVQVLSDHKPLITIFAKPILTSPKRLQRMRLQNYPLKVTSKPGPQILIRDTLSRAALPIRHAKQNSPDYAIFQVSKEEKLRQEENYPHNTAVVGVFSSVLIPPSLTKWFLLGDRLL